MWLITRTHTKKEQLFGFQFGKVLAGQTQEHFPSTCPFSIYQRSDVLGSTHQCSDLDNAQLLWWSHNYTPWLAPSLHLPTAPAPCPAALALCHIPSSRETLGTTTHRWVGSVQPRASKHNPSFARVVQMVWCTPPRPNLLFVLCKSHPFTNQPLLQHLMELKPNREYQDLIVRTQTCGKTELLCLIFI